jgi:hypothetical protein
MRIVRRLRLNPEIQNLPSGPRNFLEPQKVSISLETNPWGQPSI